MLFRIFSLAIILGGFAEGTTIFAQEGHGQGAAEDVAAGHRDTPAVAPGCRAVPEEGSRRAVSRPAREAALGTGCDARGRSGVVTP
jgi:hypothetical protein